MQRGEIGEGKEVVVNNAGAAMYDNERPTSRGLQVSKDLVPGFAWLVSAGDNDVKMSFHLERGLL